MAFTMSNVLETTNSPEINELNKKLWEAEDLGGITEDNNRMPVPVVWLLLLTVLTAFAITFPLWGQRPTAAIYAGFVKDLGKPEIQALADDAAMAKIVADHKSDELAFQQERHPITMDTLRALKGEFEKLPAGADLKDYTVVGVKIVLANFEGNYRANGTRERQQPWWDKGYTIDVFYVIIFFLGATLVIKNLPPSSWQPKHGHEH